MTLFALTPCADVLQYEGPPALLARLSEGPLATQDCDQSKVKILSVSYEGSEDGYQIFVTQGGNTKEGFAADLDEALAIVEATLLMPSFTQAEESPTKEVAPQQSDEVERIEIQPEPSSPLSLSIASGAVMGIRFTQLYSLDASYDTGWGFSVGAASSFENQRELMALRLGIFGSHRFIDNFWTLDGRAGVGYAIGTDWESFNTSPFARIGLRGGFKLNRKLRWPSLIFPTSSESLLCFVCSNE